MQVPLATVLAVAIAMAQASPSSTPTSGRQSPQAPPRDTILTAEAPGLKLFYRPQPFFGGLARLFQEAPRTAPLAKKDWPVARLELTKAFSVEKSRLEPGNYALVL